MGEAGRHLDWLIARNPDRRPENLQSIVLGIDTFWLRLVSDVRLLDIAQMFIGPDIALFGAHYFCKPPQDGKAILWHQDARKRLSANHPRLANSQLAGNANFPQRGRCSGFAAQHFAAPPTKRRFLWAAQVGVSDFAARYHAANTPQNLRAPENLGLELSVIHATTPL